MLCNNSFEFVQLLHCLNDVGATDVSYKYSRQILIELH